MRKTLILLLIATGLASYVYFYEIEGGKSREKEKEIAEKLFHLEKDSINQIMISGQGEIFEFRKNGSEWQIVQPVRTDADNSPINSLISSAVNLKKVRTIKTNGEPLAPYGLASRARTLEVRTNSGESASILIGDETEIGSNVYVSQVDSLVHLVTSSLKSNSGKTLFEWRNKKAINIDKNDVREIQLRNRSGNFVFEKQGQDWMITEPLDSKADKSTIDAMLNKLDFGRITKVLSEDAGGLSKFNLNKPEIDVELLIGANKARKGIVLSKLMDNSANAKDDSRPHVFTVDSAFVTPFAKKLFDFRDKTIVEFDDSNVDRLNLLMEDTLLTFNKDTTDNWVLSSGERAQNWKVNNVVRDVKNLKAKRFVEEKPSYLMPYGLTNPRGRIEIFFQDDKLAELDFGLSRRGRIYVRNPRVGSVVEIEESDLEKLFPSKSDLIDKTSTTGI